MSGSAVLIITNGYDFVQKYPGDIAERVTQYLKNLGKSNSAFVQFLRLFHSTLLLDTECDTKSVNSEQLNVFFNHLQKQPLRVVALSKSGHKRLERRQMASERENRKDQQLLNQSRQESLTRSGSSIESGCTNCIIL